MANSAVFAGVSTARGDLVAMRDASLHDQKLSITFPTALSQSTDGKQLFVADSSLNAIAIFDVSRINSSNPVYDVAAQRALGFIPSGWYPSALAVIGDNLLVATAKGEGTGPINGPNAVKEDGLRRRHPYIVSLLYGSISRIHIPTIKEELPELTRQVEESNLLHRDPGKMEIQSAPNPNH